MSFLIRRLMEKETPTKTLEKSQSDPGTFKLEPPRIRTNSGTTIQPDQEDGQCVI